MGIEQSSHGKGPQRKRQEYRKRGKLHVADGFPHYSTIYIPHHCICLAECCQSWDDGCICLTCPCRNGHPHGVHALVESEAASEEIAS